MTSNELSKQPSLATIFQAACVALQQNREQINRADLADGNYGDQIVEVFQIAVEAAQENQNAGLSKAMEVAGLALEGRSTNKAAQAYAIGLRQLALQLSEKGIPLEELLAFVQQRLNKNQESKDPSIEQRSGEVIKALVSGLANWERVEQGKRPADQPITMGVLFDFGIAYLQAKLQFEERVEILAEAVVSVCPLGKRPESKLSGRIAFQALLEAMQTQAHP